MQVRPSYKQEARILKALGNASRLVIVDSLREGERSVGALTERVGTDQSTVSKHLAVLRAAGIVDDRRQGSMVFYRLTAPCVLDVLACARRILTGELAPDDVATSRGGPTSTDR